MEKKGEVLQQFSQRNGKLCLVISTTAFGMGVDCPDIGRGMGVDCPDIGGVLHWGDASNT